MSSNPWTTAGQLAVDTLLIQTQAATEFHGKEEFQVSLRLCFLSTLNINLLLRKRLFGILKPLQLGLCTTAMNCEGAKVLLHDILFIANRLLAPHTRVPLLHSVTGLLQPGTRHNNNTPLLIRRGSTVSIRYCLTAFQGVILIAITCRFVIRVPHGKNS